MDILEHLDKNKLHHAYLLEGNKENILSEVLKFVETLGISTNSPDFCHIVIDNFKIDDAFYLKSMSSQMSITISKKIFIISANNFSPNAQNALLKLFEEPIFNTHFFVIVPDSDGLFKTLISRFYVINLKESESGEVLLAEKFVSMPLLARIDFIKELLTEPENIIIEDSTRAKSLKFLNALETVLHKRFSTQMSKGTFDIYYFEQIFKVRQFLRQPGSSTKSLMESVALVVPNF